MFTEADLEAIAALRFWAQDPAYQRFEELGPLAIYNKARQVVLNSPEYQEIEQIAELWCLPAGGYSLQCWAENVADVLRAIRTSKIDEPKTVEEWVKAIANEFKSNHEAAAAILLQELGSWIRWW